MRTSLRAIAAKLCDIRISQVTRRSPHLHRRTHEPGHELRAAVSELLALGGLARGDLEQIGEDLIALAFDAGLARGDWAAVKIHVITHAPKHVRVRGELDRWRRL